MTPFIVSRRVSIADLCLVGLATPSPFLRFAFGITVYSIASCGRWHITDVLLPKEGANGLGVAHCGQPIDLQGRTREPARWRGLTDALGASPRMGSRYQASGLNG